jgi:hypothetical protein
MTIGEIEALHKKQLAEISNNSDDIFPSELEEPERIEK